MQEASDFYYFVNVFFDFFFDQQCCSPVYCKPGGGEKYKEKKQGK
jgi:hypothetical protein